MKRFYWRGKEVNFWVVSVILFIVGISLIGVFVILDFSQNSYGVQTNLPRPPVDGERTWVFIVNGKETNPGDIVKVNHNFLEISVIELPKGKDVELSSGKEIDRFNIGALVHRGDLIAYDYDSPYPREGREEGLSILIISPDKSVREISIKINK